MPSSTVASYPQKCQTQTHIKFIASADRFFLNLSLFKQQQQSNTNKLNSITLRTQKKYRWVWLISSSVWNEIGISAYLEHWPYVCNYLHLLRPEGGNYRSRIGNYLVRRLKLIAMDPSSLFINLQCFFKQNPTRHILKMHGNFASCSCSPVDIFEQK